MPTLYDVAHFCSWNGYTEDMRSYLGVDTSSWTNREFWSPHGANILYGPNKKSRIQIICEHGSYCDSQIQRIRQLIADGAKPDIKDVNGCTALLVCARNGGTNNLNIIKLLFDAGADVNQANVTYNYTPLIYSANNGHIEIVRELIRRGADVRFMNKGGRAAIEYAAESGHIDVVKELLAAGAIMNPEIFCSVIKSGNIAMLKYLVRIARPAEDSIWNAVHYKQPNMIRVLAKAGADMNFNYPTHWAIQEDDNKCLIELCKNGANLSLLDQANDSPIRQAILMGNHEAIRILASYKANINEVTGVRHIPLIHYAIDMYKSFPFGIRKECLFAIIEAGPNFKILDRHGNTAAEHAVKKGIPALVTLIKRAEMKQQFELRGSSNGNFLLGAKEVYFSLPLEIEIKNTFKYNV